MTTTCGPEIPSSCILTLSLSHSLYMPVHGSPAAAYSPAHTGSGADYTRGGHGGWTHSSRSHTVLDGRHDQLLARALGRALGRLLHDAQARLRRRTHTSAPGLHALAKGKCKLPAAAWGSEPGKASAA